MLCLCKLQARQESQYAVNLLALPSTISLLSLPSKVMTGIAKEERAGKRTPQWIHDFKLADFGDQGLFYEYLEMSE